MIWQEHHREYLVSLKQSTRESNSKIARHLSRVWGEEITVNAVKAQIHKLRDTGELAPVRTWFTPEDDRAIKDAREAGLSWQQVAKKLGRTRHSVKRRAQRLNGIPKPPSVTDDELVWRRKCIESNRRALEVLHRYHGEAA